MTAVPEHAPAHLLRFLNDRQIDATFIMPGVPMPSVRAAAAAIGAAEEEIFKTLLFTSGDGAFVVAIANGTRRINSSLLAEAADLTRLRTASPDAVLAVTGYPAGGVAPFALPFGLPVVVDEQAAALSSAFVGGGCEDLLLRVKPADIILHNNARIARIVVEP